VGVELGVKVGVKVGVELGSTKRSRRGCFIFVPLFAGAKTK